MYLYPEDYFFRSQEVNRKYGIIILVMVNIFMVILVVTLFLLGSQIYAIEIQLTKVELELNDTMFKLRNIENKLKDLQMENFFTPNVEFFKMNNSMDLEDIQEYNYNDTFW